MGNLYKFLAGLVVVFVIFAISFMTSYNKIPTLDENVVAKWSQVENQYKRRADLVPNLVSVVQGYAKHEKTTLNEVVEARSKAISIKVDAQSLSNPEAIKAYSEAQGALGSALSRLIMLTENYPELKANENFLELQSQLEGTENRIAVARKDYIEATKEFNLALRTIPTKFIAKMFFPDLKPKEPFSVTAEEKAVPKVEF
ncbi:MAG: LemA family protein [Campylobacteraceae bacterium]|nr:LemA family protein [Campylobacteraceae bacterium]